MINTTILMGRLTADPELKFTAGGISYCRFTLAVERSYTKAGAERQTDFISCIAWRGTADFVDKYFMKGQLIAVQGSIQTGTYTDNDNVKHYTFDVLVSSVSFTGDKRENGTQTSDVQYKPSEEEERLLKDDLAF